MRDRVFGCLLGGALGDALGGVAERGRSCLSDDTQLTLATCESITAARGADPAHLAATFRKWFEERRLVGLGSSTLKALRDLQAGAHWALAGARGEMAAANGAAMRIAPLAFLAVDRVRIRDTVRITHHSDEAYIGALAVVEAIRMDWPPALPELLHELGYVVDTVPLALAGAWNMTSGSFEGTLDELVDIGGDTDTIASIAGQVAGARRGVGGLPSSLLDFVPERKMIEDIADGFVEYLEAGPSALS